MLRAANAVDSQDALSSNESLKLAEEICSGGVGDPVRFSATEDDLAGVSSPKWVTEYAPLAVSDDEDEDGSGNERNSSVGSAARGSVGGGGNGTAEFRRRTTRVESVRRPSAAVRAARNVQRQQRPVTIFDREALLSLLAGEQQGEEDAVTVDDVSEPTFVVEERKV
jgi:hypothetical protein